jgi:hypothetical protein
MDPRVRPKVVENGDPSNAPAGDRGTLPMQRFVTEDGYIRHGISTTAVVIYGNRKIGPEGAISDHSVGAQGGL